MRILALVFMNWPLFFFPRILDNTIFLKEIIKTQFRI